MNEKMIAKLESKGFNRWTKGNFDRLYINPQKLGLEVEYYKTGNVSGSKWNGEHISHAEARRMLNAKIYIDLKDDSLHCDHYWCDTLKDAAQELIDEATAEIEAEEKSEVEKTQAVEETEDAVEKGFAGMFGEETAELINEAAAEILKNVKASWTIRFWKSGSGYTHAETVEWSHDHEMFCAEDAKKAVLDWWYDGQWNDQDHDGHHWLVSYYKGESDPMFSEPLDTVDFWVYPEDFA